MERIDVPKIDDPGSIVGKIRAEKYTGEENVGVLLSKLPNDTSTIFGYADPCTVCKKGYGVTNYIWNPALTASVSDFCLIHHICCNKGII